MWLCEYVIHFNHDTYTPTFLHYPQNCILPWGNNRYHIRHEIYSTSSTEYKLTVSCILRVFHRLFFAHNRGYPCKHSSSFFSFCVCVCVWKLIFYYNNTFVCHSLGILRQLLYLAASYSENFFYGRTL